MGVNRSYPRKLQVVPGSGSWSSNFRSANCSWGCKLRIPVLLAAWPGVDEDADEQCADEEDRSSPGCGRGVSIDSGRPRACHFWMGSKVVRRHNGSDQCHPEYLRVPGTLCEAQKLVCCRLAL